MHCFGRATNQDGLPISEWACLYCGLSDDHKDIPCTGKPTWGYAKVQRDLTDLRFFYDRAQRTIVDLRLSGAKTKRLLEIAEQHTSLLQPQFDEAIKQRDDARDDLRKTRTANEKLQLRIDALLDEIAGLRKRRFAYKVDTVAINGMLSRAGWKDAPQIIVPLTEKNFPDGKKWSEAASAVIDRILPIETTYPSAVSQADGVADESPDKCETCHGYHVGGCHKKPQGVSVKKYPGVLWATHEALNAQERHGATVADAQAYLDYCEAHSICGPYYGYQQWAAIYRGASGRPA